MNQSPERISYLLDRYRLKEASMAEVDELFSLLTERDLEQILSVTHSEPLDIDRWDPVLKSILTKAETPKAMVVHMPFWIKYRKLTIAASVALILASASVILFSNKHEKTIAVTTQVNTDALPGGNKAILTLGNGSKIILDSANLGLLAQQGLTNITKKDLGQLIYESKDKNQSQIVLNTLSTPRGGQYKLELPDGTKVWLNAASSITYPTAFIGKDRQVEVTGEAYFEVIHNAKMPFKVKSGNQIIEDIGTAFNINAYADEQTMNTTLVEGLVNVNGIRLKPGEQARDKAGKISVEKNVDLDNVLAWKNGYFSFNQTDLPTVMRQLARWYDVQVEYQGPVPSMKFGGEITRNTNASQVLKILEASKVHFILKNHTIIVTQ